MTACSGVAIGTVADLADPEGEGRVLVEYQMLAGAPRSNWAAIAMPFAGKDRGTFFMPEVGDEALLAFHHGRFDHPFIIGFLWNGVDTPPASGIDEHVRRIRTTSGHEIDLDDRAGREAVTIRTQAGNEIEMSDAPGAVHIAITTSGGQTVDIADLPVPLITVSAPAGQVKVECLQAQVQASAMLQVTAPITMFSGVVQAQTVITNTLVGTAYTPGAGNIW